MGLDISKLKEQLRQSYLNLPIKVENTKVIVGYPEEERNERYLNGENIADLYFYLEVIRPNTMRIVQPECKGEFREILKDGLRLDIELMEKVFTSKPEELQKMGEARYIWWDPEIEEKFNEKIRNITEAIIKEQEEEHRLYLEKDIEPKGELQEKYPEIPHLIKNYKRVVEDYKELNQPVPLTLPEFVAVMIKTPCDRISDYFYFAGEKILPKIKKAYSNAITIENFPTNTLILGTSSEEEAKILEKARKSPNKKTRIYIQEKDIQIVGGDYTELELKTIQGIVKLIYLNENLLNPKGFIVVTRYELGKAIYEDKYRSNKTKYNKLIDQALWGEKKGDTIKGGIVNKYIYGIARYKEVGKTYKKGDKLPTIIIKDRLFDAKKMWIGRTSSDKEYYSEEEIKEETEKTLFTEVIKIEYSNPIIFTEPNFFKAIDFYTIIIESYGVRSKYLFSLIKFFITKAHVKDKSGKIGLKKLREKIRMKKRNKKEIISWLNILKEVGLLEDYIIKTNKKGEEILHYTLNTKAIEGQSTTKKLPTP